MLTPNLFAAQEREAKLSKLGDALQVIERHVDFAALATAVDQAAQRPGTNAEAVRRFRPK